MTRIWRFLSNLLASTLEPAEREAVCGDLAELSQTGIQALRDLGGLVARRQLAVWSDFRPWAALIGIVFPLSIILPILSKLKAEGSAVYIWMYVNNWDWAFVGYPKFLSDMAGYGTEILISYLALFCWSWTAGVVLGAQSRKAIVANGAIFCIILLTFDLVGGPQYLLGRFFFPRSNGIDNHAAIHAVTFYRVAFPFLIQLLLVVVPLIWGMRMKWSQQFLRVGPLLTLAALTIALLVRWYFWGQQSRPAFWSGVQTWLPMIAYWPVAYLIANRVARHRQVLALLCISASLVGAAERPTNSAALRAPADRKPAPLIELTDDSGRLLKLKDYQGKVVLLDFWATWCGGCKEELPWFAELQRTYASKGFTVIGVSLDEGGWDIVKPFLASHKMPYPMVLGNDRTARLYRIEGMPEAFLIDQRGRVAAAYTEGVVNKVNLESNIKALLHQ